MSGKEEDQVIKISVEPEAGLLVDHGNGFVTVIFWPWAEDPEEDDSE